MKPNNKYVNLATPFGDCINGEQMPAWGFANASDESEYVQLSQAWRHVFASHDQTNLCKVYSTPVLTFGSKQHIKLKENSRL